MKHALALSLALACGLVTLAPVPAPSHAAAFNREQVDNPNYTNWARFKPGTTIKTRTISEFGGQRNEMNSTIRLIEVTPSKVVIETQTNSNYAGNIMKGEPQRSDIPAKIDRLPTTDTVRPKTGQEEVTVAGKRYRATWTETVLENSGIRTTSRTWSSDDFPGMTLRSQSRMEGSTSGMTSMEVVEVSMG
jgi:hypothetical protein